MFIYHARWPAGRRVLLLRRVVRRDHSLNLAALARVAAWKDRLLEREQKWLHIRPEPHAGGDCPR